MLHKGRKGRKTKKAITRHSDITPRDINIFRSLGPGPKTLIQLKDTLSEFAKGNQCGQQILNHDLKIGTLKSRINKLCNAGYLKSSRYRTIDGKAFALYTLTPESAPILEKTGYKTRHMRMIFPHENTVSHEMIVVKVVERYWKEPEEIKKGVQTLKISIDFSDENDLKSRSKGGKKGWRYPDLFTVLTFEREDKYCLKKYLAVEIDNGSMPPNRVFAKIKSMYDRTNWTIVMLCPNAARINKFQGAFKKEMNLMREKAKTYDEKLDKLLDMVVFASHEDFFLGGFLDTDWRRIDNIKATFIPGGYVG